MRPGLIMDGGEIEMSREELQSWIRNKVKKTKPVSSDMLEKCSQLQSLLQRREEQAANLLKLCESVAACEETVKKLYSLLGWEYGDTDYDDDISQSSSGQASPLSCESVHSEAQVPRPLTFAGPASKLKDSKNLRDLRRKYPLTLISEPVVVLTRLPSSEITSPLPPPSPENYQTEDDSLSNAGSDMQWEPDRDGSDSDFSVSSTKKRKKRTKTKEKRVKNHTTYQASKNTIANSSGAKRVTLKSFFSAESSAAKTSTPQASAKRLAANTAEVTPVTTRSAVSECLATKTPPAVPQDEINVSMKVLARRRPLSWQRGTVVEIITKDDGRVKYKVMFEEKGKSLVSGHHIAFDHMPKVNQLVVGTRVVIKTEDGQFVPGVMAEVPSRKNRMRFLVFIDDHTSLYVGLPVIHLVCKPLQNPLDDILDEKHKLFMQTYLKRWPYPPQSQYRVGQSVNIERNGYLQRTNVLQTDCSLIQVVFLNDNHKEWIYRGSNRLEQMMNINENSVSKGGQEEE
ncbi:histone-lysine N-methyltransferase SETDB1-B-like [Archocentrus centrarchus]|uniref:histone-lysine N-methyltransferase SETDB1-B-like n=1 Tax=Archocentrus centrarchus TaxID=63155 RepID=UPI0011EA2647|nr:histone-lysine N-methyltransferase SETDB1-B-like [Archocentrus centrarchus]